VVYAPKIIQIYICAIWHSSLSCNAIHHIYLTVCLHKKTLRVSTYTWLLIYLHTHAADWRIPIPSYLYRHILLYTSILYVRAWSGPVLSLRSRKYYIIIYVIIIGSIHIRVCTLQTQKRQATTGPAESDSRLWNTKSS